MYEVYLDTTDRYNRLVQLKKDGQIIDEIKVTTKKGDDSKQPNHYDTALYHSRAKDDILSAIDFILKRNNLKLEQIEKIKANPGPGSFTGIRVGLSIANALNYALGHIKNFKQDLQTPQYGGEPHVTIKKK